MSYSAKDLERSRRWARERALYHDQGIAELIATVRRETVEECIAEVRKRLSAGSAIEDALRALLDEPKACSRCGATDTELYSAGVCNDALACQERSEEPSHG
jgi:hypothetical protein